MLCLNTNLEVRSILTYDLQNINTNTFGYMGADHLFRFKYVETNYVNALLLPLIFNDIEYKQYTYAICNMDASPEVHNLHLTDAVDNMLSKYNDITDDNLLNYTVFTSNIDEFVYRIDTDIFVEVDDTIKAIYNKAMAQLELREGLSSTPVARVFISRVKHMVILVTNYDDYNNKTAGLLTVGLYPKLFPDLFENAEPEELDYFNELVHRSQLKRIANQTVKDMFDRIHHLRKYEDKIQAIKFKNTIYSIVNNNINAAEREMRDSYSNATNYLENYAKCKANYFKAQERLERLKDNADEVKEEYVNALSMPYITRVNYSGNHIIIGIKSTLDFYDTDEVECAIRSTGGDTYRLMEKVFLNGEYKMKVYSEFFFNISPESSFRSPGSLDVWNLADDKVQAMYNPHLQYFSCLGTYKPQLIDAEAKQDITAFVNIALASTRSINFKDGAVTGRWFGDLTRAILDNSILANIKCLVDAEGNEYSIKEVLEEPVEETVEETTEPELTEEDNRAIDEALATATAIANGEQVELEYAIDEARHEEVEEEFVW